MRRARYGTTHTRALHHSEIKPNRSSKHEIHRISLSFWSTSFDHCSRGTMLAIRSSRERWHLEEVSPMQRLKKNGWPQPDTFSKKAVKSGRLRKFSVEEIK